MIGYDCVRTGTRVPDTARVRTALASVIVLAAAAVAWAPAATAQSVLERPPVLSGGWIGPSGTVHFNMIHRFNHSGAPQRNVTVSPTFLLAGRVLPNVLLGANYATNSPVVPRKPNEWEFFGRYRPIAEERGPFDLALQAGYNLGASSFDGEASVARSFGPLRIMAVGRAFTDAYGAEETRYAAGGGLVLRLRDHVGFGADVVQLTDRQSGEEQPAWSAGLLLGIPYTPHTLSLHLTNTRTATLQGASRGASRARFGFEFTVPVTLARYIRRPTVAAPATEPDALRAAGDTVVASIRQLAYAPARIEIPAGTTIVWRNEDVVPHTVTATDESWDSGEFDPGESWAMTFDEPGTYPFRCIPHPFMTGEVVVR